MMLIGCDAELLLLLRLTVISYAAVRMVESTYIGVAVSQTRTANQKRNDAKYLSTISKPAFTNDEEIRHYLKWSGKDLMIWKCRNAIKAPTSNHYVDLYCQVIGTIRAVSWFHNGQLIPLKLNKASRRGRYRQRIMPHIDRHGTVYSWWIDFRLRIRRPWSRDSGTYTFHVTSPSGSFAQQLIYVDLISEQITSTNRSRRH